MEVPIANALGEEYRIPIAYEALNFSDLELTFKEFPKDRLKLFAFVGGNKITTPILPRKNLLPFANHFVFLIIEDLQVNNYFWLFLSQLMRTW